VSFRAVIAAIELRGISATEKLVLILAAQYADEQGKCWPSQATLAAETGLTDRSIRRLLEGLEEKGLIARKQRFSSDGRRLSDIMALQLPGLCVRPPRTLATGDPDTESGNPINEPIKEKNPPAPKGAEDIVEAIGLYNELARDHDLPRAVDITDIRRKAVGARLKEQGLDGWKVALAAVAESRHCLGKNDRKWRANLDFVASPNGFAKLREGFYSGAPRLHVVEHDPWPGRLREYRMNGWWEILNWGPRPGEPGCKAPADLLAKAASKQAGASS
jgi:Helix-turn-helix domain